MSQNRLTQLEELCSATTHGPWQPVLGRKGGHQTVGLWHGTEYFGNFLVTNIIPSDGTPVQAVQDARFMAEARTAIPELITDIRQLSAEMARLHRIADRAISRGVQPGTADRLLASHVLAGKPPHHYLSAACEDAGRLTVSNLHSRCRSACEFCGAKCLCSCHSKEHHRG